MPTPRAPDLALLGSWQVDASQLLASGRLSISAVPEPATVPLWLLGGTVLLTQRSRRTRRNV